MAAFYDFSVTSLQGELLPLSTYKGKVVLVVNTASQCGFTPQYQGLQSLYKTYREQGLVILGFPCNQFGQQEPGNSEAISEFCEINYGVDFPMFEKVDVKGATSHPLFAYLTGALPGLLGKNIKWNFTKFLIGRDGQPIKRYAPLTKPEALEADIKAAIKADI